MNMLAMNFSHFFDIVAIPFGHVMRFFNWICGGQYALALLLFAVVVKLLMLPLSIKQQKSMIKGAMLRPKLLLIEKKYAGRNDRVTLQKKQQEIMEMQRKEGYSPLSGCLPLLLQLPIIFGLYRIIRMPIKYVFNLADEQVLKICNTVLNPAEQFTKISQTQSSQIEVINQLRGGEYNELLQEVNFSGNIPEFDLSGVDLAYNPGFDVSKLGDSKVNLWLLLIPFLCGALAYLSMWITRKVNDNGLMTATAGDQKKSMNIMSMTMPLMSLWIAFITPGVIGLYWVYTSILGIAQTLLFAKFMPMPKYTDEQIKEIQRAMKNNKSERNIVGTSVDENGKPKSLHYEDDDDY